MNLGLLHCLVDSLLLRHLGSPWYVCILSQHVCGVSFSCPLVLIPVLHQCHTILSTMTSFAKARPAILFSFFKTTWLFLVMGFSTSIFHVYLEPSKFYEIPLGCSESIDHFLEKWHLKNIFSSNHEHGISFCLNLLEPHAQGAVAARVQEGLEDLSHVEGQEGQQWGDTLRPRLRSSGCPLLEQPWRDTPHPR